MVLVGCGKTSAPTTAGNTPNVTQGVGKMLPAVGREFVLEDLRQLGIYYQSHLIAAGQGPAKLEDWQELKKDLPNLYQALEDGRYVMIWNTSSALMAEGPSRTILAYEKDAPTKGGVVLLGDGSVKNMTLKEFQSAPRAKRQ
jgi:hypothetical protein